MNKNKKYNIHKKEVYIIVPAYNENDHLYKLLDSIKKYISFSNIIVVDDGSSSPLQISSKYSVWLLKHKINLGKGMAMRTGAEFAFQKKAKAIIFIDADGQHDPKEIPKYIKNFRAGFDLVLGSRKPSLNSPPIRYLGNKFAAIYIYLFFGVYVSDILSGYRGLTYKAYQILKWDSPRYGVEAEMIARLGKQQNNLKWIEIPIETIYKDKDKGVTLIQAIKILGETIWWK